MVSPSLSTAREYEEADRGRVLSLMKKAGSIDSKENHVIVIEDGATFGCLVWLEPGIDIANDLPSLGMVAISEPGRMDIYEDLIDKAAAAAQAAGHTRAQAVIRREAVLILMRSIFVFTETAHGRHTKTGKTAHWTIEFDLAENRAILAKRRKLR